MLIEMLINRTLSSCKHTIQSVSHHIQTVPNHIQTVSHHIQTGGLLVVTYLTADSLLLQGVGHLDFFCR